METIFNNEIRPVLMKLKPALTNALKEVRKIKVGGFRLGPLVDMQLAQVRAQLEVRDRPQNTTNLYEVIWRKLTKTKISENSHRNPYTTSLMKDIIGYYKFPISPIFYIVTLIN